MTNYAIVKASGRQLWFEPGKYYNINYVHANPGDKIIFYKVLLLKNTNSLLIGKPFVEKVEVHATILQHLKDKKITVFKMQAKKGTKKKKGYKTVLTKIKINCIHNHKK
uniref:Large ribosomal subunit protein bL21c n=1 Tax=Cyanidium caldarium TaxID=2771 RepID=RK21_CYACA|nr:ribosomal protein L21 [Cyanidium caldarium]O19884.1 RecName: Full=Large ribosomal subunit protein bL21c; AltName: Full=50S ribosomal protein L21, chloroplastic [Cyanidium caldarium]AAB82705.1 unknown [Cyanidium caldarium]WDB00183.1 ribosomal protein L21 [Cyanidium caldarium]